MVSCKCVIKLILSIHNYYVVMIGVCVEIMSSLTS